MGEPTRLAGTPSSLASALAGENLGGITTLTVEYTLSTLWNLTTMSTRKVRIEDEDEVRVVNHRMIYEALIHLSGWRHHSRQLGYVDDCGAQELV